METVSIFLVGFAIGIALGAVITGFIVLYMLRKGDRDVPRSAKLGTKHVQMMAAVFVAALVLASQVSPTFAQVPTLDIPTDTIFTETNTWMNTFAPIAAIGIGITIAIAVLAYIGKQIKGAFA